MELVASLPPDIAAAADPAARGAASPLRCSRQDDGAATPSASFDLLLAMLATPLPGGATLPAAGNALPVSADVEAAAGDALTGGVAKPVTLQPGTTSGTDLLARLKLTLAAGVQSPPTADGEEAPPAQGSSAPAVATFADLDLPTPVSPLAQPQVDKPTVAAAPAPPPAAALAAVPPPVADATTALEAMPAAPGAEPMAKTMRFDSARISERRDAALAAAATADLRPATADRVPALTLPAAVTDSLARPAQRDLTLDALVPIDGTAGADASSSIPAPAHTPLHAAGTARAAESAAAAAGTPIDTNADHWHEALASRVQVLVDQHVGEARIKLSPPELGSLDVKISLVDDKTFVQLTAGTSAARDELAQSLPRLRELFSASGLSLGGATVQSGFGGQAGHAGQDSAARSATPGYSPLRSPVDDDFEPVRTVARPTSRIDLFA